MSSGVAIPASSMLNASLPINAFTRVVMKPGASLTITTSFPIRRATSREVATVSLEVCGVLTNSMSFIFGTGLKKCIPMQRSRETVTSVKSVIEREEVLLAKMAPVLANLSKMVKSSSFISSSSGTASMQPDGAAQPRDQRCQRAGAEPAADSRPEHERRLHLRAAEPGRRRHCAVVEGPARPARRGSQAQGDRLRVQRLRPARAADRVRGRPRQGEVAGHP